MSQRATWLNAFVAADKFFTPCCTCASQHSAREATINYWDIDAQQELCSICVNDFPRENVIQVSVEGTSVGRKHYFSPRISHFE